MYLTKEFNQRTVGATERLQTSTIRSYDGGLNVADTDLNMSPKFAKVLDNVERGTDGTLSIRPGTKYFATVGGSSVAIVNVYYFNGYVIVVKTDGTFWKVDGSGAVTPMTLVVGGGNPFTSGTQFVSFTIFNSDLIVANGKDKPILISGNPSNANYMKPDFLQDLASGSNVNTPVGAFVIAHGQYTCIAGISAQPSYLFISAKGTSGTWLSDPIPNDAIAMDLGPRVSLGSATITGMVAYRDKLLVAFERGVLPMNLGIYTTDATPVHVPTDDGFIEEYGCLSHRTLISLGDDTYYADNVGVNSATRLAFYNTLRALRVSQLVDPLITPMMTALSQAQITQFVFAIYDLRHFRYMLFIPSFASDGVTVTETIGFSYTNIPTLKVAAWARLRGWTWRCACRTALQNIVFGGGNKLYTYDFDDTDTNIDFNGDTDINSGKGVPVSFTWELPWADFQARTNTKTVRYIGLDTKGTGEFTCEMYVDNYYNNATTPMLSMTMVAGDAAGYGSQLYGDSPYGGGRRSSDERLYAFNTKFKLMKLRFYGTTNYKVKFVSISVNYLRGSIRR